MRRREFLGVLGGAAGMPTGGARAVKSHSSGGRYEAG